LNQRPPLFERFPTLEKQLPRISLGCFPTPVHPLTEVAGERLWIKRDDLSSPHYGGNKVRKLEFLLADARSKNKRRIVTIGGLGTNHGLATAVFCRLNGLECNLILFDQPVTAQVKQNLRLFHSYNARVTQRGFMTAALCDFFILRRLTNPKAYFIYPGGSSVVGTMGFVNAALELKTQVDSELMPEPAAVFCPLGSGGTLAGLMVGFWLAGMKTRVVGVRVTSAHLGPVPICTSFSVDRLARKTAAFLHKHLTGLPTGPLPGPLVLNNYNGRGYGYPTAAGAHGSTLMKEKENIALDPCYTAKTFAAVLDYCRQSHATAPVLYWHTHNAVDLRSRAQSVSAVRFSKKTAAVLRRKEIADD
jgi:1-aminocyclopropane-1-carboxylate deaminase/D-cysteine desulfhydrase-like pyridoxal-dependent ACC family enzyme